MLLDHADEYQRLAVGIISKCYEDNPKKTRALLTCKLKNWGYLTCLQLAMNGVSWELISHPAVQHLVENIWLGEKTYGSGL